MDYAPLEINEAGLVIFMPASLISFTIFRVARRTLLVLLWRYSPLKYAFYAISRLNTCYIHNYSHN